MKTRKDFIHKCKATTTFIFAVIMSLSFGACSDDDNSEIFPETPLSDLIYGTWWAVYPEEGTVGTGDFAQTYDYVGQALCLNADSTGYAVSFFFKEGIDEPVYVIGGKNFARFTYIAKPDGDISLDLSKAYSKYAEYYSKWTMKYGNNSIYCSADGNSFQMKPGNEWERVQIVNWDLAANGGNDGYGQKRVNIENDGERYHKQWYFTLNNFIDKYNPSGTENWLTKSGSISLDLKVCPIYMQSSNGSKAGDYYFVTCAVTPHNNDLWGPYTHTHAASKIRIYGYWFKEMDLEVQLLNADGSQIPGLQYYERPIPENVNDSRTYSNGKTISVTGSLSGSYTENPGGGGSAGVSVGGSWTSSTSYTLTTVNYILNSSSPIVKYHYYTENVKLKDNWDKMDEYFPPSCHSEFTGHSYWVWYVPYDASGKNGVKDGLVKNFCVKANIKATYSSWYHWRAALEYDNNRKDYSVSFNTDKDFQLPQPDRTPWGIIALKNAANYEMAHVKFYREDEKDMNHVASLTGSYSKGQEAKQALPEGTYTITYDAIDGNTNDFLGQWIVENVKVHQGPDEATATTNVSTVDAKIVHNE